MGKKPFFDVKGQKSLLQLEPLHLHSLILRVQLFGWNFEICPIVHNVGGLLPIGSVVKWVCDAFDLNRQMLQSYHQHTQMVSLEPTKWTGHPKTMRLTSIWNPQSVNGLFYGTSSWDIGHIYDSYLEGLFHTLLHFLLD